MDFNATVDIKPKLNGFDLSHNHFTTMNMGGLYPIAWFECLPGDIHRLDIQALIRVQPMISPILNNLTCDIHAFFVPTRLLWKDWESFITTIVQGKIPPATYSGLPPVWCQHDDDPDSVTKLVDIKTDSHSIWDMLGLSRKFNKKAKAEYRPTDFIRRAYLKVWNDWFRDENLQEEIDYYNSDHQDILPRAWRKDYFTAAYYTRQKGNSPSVPLNLQGSVTWDKTFDESLDSIHILQGVDVNAIDLGSLNIYYNNGNSKAYAIGTTKSVGAYPASGKADMIAKNREAFLDYLNNNTGVTLKGATFTVDDLRDVFAIQKFMTRLMSSGSRYVEFLQSQFNVNPGDSRLQLAERIGGTTFNIQISEVIQTGQQTDAQGTPLGTQSGHGLSVSAGSLGSYKCLEFGYIIVLANIQPPAVYTDRMPRSLYRKTLLEQFNPHFVNLSFQEVRNREIYAIGDEQDEGVWAFDGRYDELRELQSYISGDLYDKLSYYLNFRKFADKPAFNKDFIECNPGMDIFKVQDEPPFICNFYCNFKSLRPMPLVSEPGLIDHVYGGL